MSAKCPECDRLWEEYRRLAEVRLRLIREQQTRTEGGPVPLRAPLGLRVQMLAEAQMEARKRQAVHDIKAHGARRLLCA